MSPSRTQTGLALAAFITTAVLIAATATAAPSGPDAPASASTDATSPTPTSAPTPSSSSPDTPPGPARARSGSVAYHEAFFEVETINLGLPPVAKTPARSTPQATLESLRRACATEGYEAAAHLVDWSFVAVAERPSRAQALMPELCYLLERKVDVDWTSIPNRPDGQHDRPNFPNDPLAGKPRRSILVSSLEVDGRDATLRLRRLKPERGEPIWLVSPHFVDDVAPLYERYGPNDYERYIPSPLREAGWGSVRWWELLALPICLFVALGLGWLLARIASAALRRASSVWSDLVQRHIERPLIVFIAVTIFDILTLVVLRLGGTLGQVLSPIAVLALIAAAAWTITRAVSAVADFIRRRDSDDLSDPAAVAARKRMTHLSVISRLVSFIIVCAATGVFLSEVGMLQSLSLVLLSSAGAMGVLLGVAGHRVLGNLIAGLQIGLTKPVRIGDCVVFDGEYGWVENLTYTYVTIRLFDHQRLIVPFTYFLSQPIFNKSHTDPKLNEPIFLWVDASADLDVLRHAYLHMVEGQVDWDDTEEPLVEVVEVDRDDLKVRLRATAEDPAKAWRFSCQLREKLVAFMRTWDDGAYLPRRRHELVDPRSDPQSGRRPHGTVVPANAG